MAGRLQSSLLGSRLASVPIDVVFHSPFPCAAASARELAQHPSGVPVAEAAELVDHIPFVPAPADTPHAWTRFLDGYDEAEAAAVTAIASAESAPASPPARPSRLTRRPVSAQGLRETAT